MVLLFKTVDGPSECTAGEARLRHDVVLFGRSERRLTEQVLRSVDVLWIAAGPECRGGVAEAVQIDCEAKCQSRASPHSLIDTIAGHRTA